MKFVLGCLLIACSGTVLCDNYAPLLSRGAKQRITAARVLLDRPGLHYSRFDEGAAELSGCEFVERDVAHAAGLQVVLEQVVLEQVARSTPPWTVRELDVGMRMVLTLSDGTQHKFLFEHALNAGAASRGVYFSPLPPFSALPVSLSKAGGDALQRWGGAGLAMPVANLRQQQLCAYFSKLAQ